METVFEQEFAKHLLEGWFREKAIPWLSRQSPGDTGVKFPAESGMPVVKIGDAELTDRRQVEDFLAIHHALSVYIASADQIPLNLAVFGAPGSGKSFAVKQAVK